uniref:hypothetical protein n=1 Tax=Exserohilum rostratum TaxID=1659837 RepID=UPI002008EBBF|nr:hypothetical protein M1U80_mgp33 [Exserohilum rostratum]UOU81277.1 hypothetical protein [Exserohilum rostratum]
MTPCSPSLNNFSTSKVLLSKNDKYNNLNIKTSGITMWFERWFLYSNAKANWGLYVLNALFLYLYPVGTKNLIPVFQSVIWQLKSRYLAKPHAFSSMPLQSGIFTINRNILIGLVSSIITAALGYVVRLILLNFLEYDVLTNLDNLIPSLSYFCSLGGIRFVINEFLKENTFLTYHCGGNRAVSNPTAGSGSLPVGINPAGYSPMQAPNEPGIGSSGPAGSSGALVTDERSKLQERILKIEGKLSYSREQVEGARQDLDEVVSRKPMYIESGNEEQREREHYGAISALHDCNTNLSAEMRMLSLLKTKLANGDFSMSDSSATTKRSFIDSSMSNDNISTPANKRTSGNQ